MPRHAQKAPRREIRAFACAAVAAPWLVLGLVCSLQPVHTLWLLRALLFAAIAALQPHSPYISDKLSASNSKRHPESWAERHPTLSWAFRQPDVLSSSKPQHRSRVSTSKPLNSNKWSPKPSSSLPRHTCSNSRTAGTSNSSTGKGPSSSNTQTTAANTSSHSSSSGTAAPAAKSCFSGGNSGGWDDSDDGGGGGDKPRFQAVKSHSLDAPDSAAVAVAASEEPTPTNSRANSSSNTSSSNAPTGSVPSLCDTVPSGEASVSVVSAEDTTANLPLSTGSAAQLATTGPWKLSSPFSAAMTPFDSGSSASSSESSGAAGSTTQQQSQQQQQHVAAESPPAAVTGPWKLSSPFAAAPSPAFSGNVDAAATSAADAPAAKPVKQKAPVAEVVVDSKQQQKDRQQRQPRHYYEPVHMRLQKPKPPKQQQQQQEQVAAQQGTTGPWALSSPFAAAAAPPPLEMKDSAAAAAVANAAASCNASNSPVTATTGMVVSDPFGSPLPAQYGQGVAAPGSSSVAAVAGSSKDTSKAERKRERRRSALVTAPQPPSPNTGPWGLYSPFAAAVSAEAALSNTTRQLQPPGSGTSTEQSPAAAAAAAVDKTQRSGSGISARSERSGSGGNLGQLLGGNSKAAGAGSAVPVIDRMTRRDSSSDRLTETTATPSSIHTASESRGSLPFSFPSVAISAGASDATTAVTSSGTSGGLNDGLDLDLQPTPGAFAAWGGEGFSPVPSDTELTVPQCDDPSAVAGLDDAAAAAGGGGWIRAARMHDSAHSHLLQQKPAAPGSPATAGKGAIAAGLAVPAAAVQQQPTFVAAGTQAAGGVPQSVFAPAAVVGVAPAGVPAPAAPMAATYIAPTGAFGVGPFDVSPGTSLGAAAPAAAYAGVPRSSLTAIPATAGTAVYSDPAAAAAAAAAANPALQMAAPMASWPPQIKTPTPAEAAAAAGYSLSATPASPMAAPAAAAAAAAAASQAKDMSCLCCYPPCLTEGQAADVHVYVTGLDLAAEAVLRAVVVRGSVVVADVTGLCRATDGLFRVPLPALPVGPLQLGIFLDKHLCFIQSLLILPGPSAQEMILLWGSLLQSHLALQQQQQQQQALTRQQGSDKGSMEIGSDSIGSGWNSQGSTSSAGSAGGGSAGQQKYSCTEEAIAAAAASWMAAPAEPGQQQQQQGSIGGVSSVDVQVVWQKQYTPVLIDIAYLLTAQMQKSTFSPTAAAAAGSPFAGASLESSSPRSMSTAAAAAQAQINMDSPEFKSMVTHLVQFLAANGLWAVLQLITDSVYGVGASAKALYTAKAATSAAASAAASGKGGYRAGGSSGGSSTGAITRGVSQAVQVPDTTPDATPESQDTIATIGSSIGALAAPAVIDPAAAVATAVAGVEAGQSLDVGAVLLLLCLVVKSSVIGGVRYCQAEGVVPVLRHVAGACSRGVRQLGSWAFEGLALLVFGVLWVYDTLLGTEHTPGKGEATQSSHELSGALAATAVSSASAAIDCVSGASSEE